MISGTTGESPTTTDEEKDRLLRAVVEAVGDRATVVAGVGTNDTAHTVHLARAAEKAGAARAAGRHAVLQQAAAGRAARALPRRRPTPPGCRSMLYDIPGRAGTAIATETLVALAEHPRIVAVKDAKGDLDASAWVLARTDLAYYSGDDTLTLPLLSIGAVGVVGVPTHLVGSRTKRLIEALRRPATRPGRWRCTARCCRSYTGFFRTQGVDPGQGGAAAGRAARRAGAAAAGRRHPGRDRHAARRPRRRRRGSGVSGDASRPG